MEKISSDNLKSIANNIRQDIVRMLVKAGSGHPGGSLGLADIFTVLYWQILNHNPKKPNWPDRDRLVLSNGHVCPVLYSALARANYFPLASLNTLRKINSPLQGHPHNLSLPGVEVSSGPLGQGISQAVGLALAAKMDKAGWQVFCVTSDGEHNEGQLWESLLVAAKYKLGNLINIVDYNHIQIDGYTEDIMPLGSLKNKYLAFGWEVLETNGHNLKQIYKTLLRAKSYQKKPVVVIAKTIPGKGVKFMENKWQWHGTAPTPAEAAKALSELKTLY